MSLPNLLPQLGWFSLLIPAVGLVLSFRFRSRHWAVFAWMPTTLFFGYYSLWVLSKLSAFRQVSGPDAIGIGIAYLFLLPALSVSLSGLIACFFARPRREAWRLSTTLPAGLLCVGLCVLVNSPHGAMFAGRLCEVRVRLTNVKGKPLPGVTVRGVSYEDGLGVGGRQMVSDADGTFTIKLRQGQSAKLDLQHPFPPNNQLSDMPTFWTIGVNMTKTGDIVIRHTWQRSVGSKTLNEAFTEFVPPANHVDLTVVLPPHSGLVAPSLRDKIHAALLAIRAHPRPELSYEYVCRNVDAIEFIPWLIETYRSDAAARTSIVEGLSQTAAILAELNSGCRELQDRAANTRRFNQNYIDGEFTYEVNQLLAWAEVTATDRHSGLAKVRERIARHAKILCDFVVNERNQGGNVMKVFGELGQLGRPELPALMQELVQHPPRTVREAQQWGPALWRTVPMKTRFENYRPLLESNDPLLVILVCEAWGNQLETEVGPIVLTKLEELRPAIQDADTLSRVDMYLGRLRPKQSPAK